MQPMFDEVEQQNQLAESKVDENARLGKKQVDDAT